MVVIVAITARAAGTSLVPAAPKAASVAATTPVARSMSSSPSPALARRPGRAIARR